MLLWLVLVLVILWAFGFGFHVGGDLLHIVLLIAVLVFLYEYLVVRRRM